ncbi:MAG: phosphoribosylamine--glycine ligase [Euryarchaeota archaeon]|jgi:phosphoribosylamine--glycine ligase|nr:phosphoribosylamine--glycine ligase [Euryarchaeota archaeon]CAI8288529.1 MAG: Phosphoribosylamine--glycine ligase [Euryarchaeota archaeon UBA443]|tara:strand:+ start:545 stop:1807 length:1263 start_codon:yes stop_codon:yes gene_type:complete
MGRTVLIVGGGGREHALCLALSQSSSIEEIHTAPGNAGTRHFGSNHDVAASDIDGLLELSHRLQIDFVVVGPEAPLCDGLADKLLSKGIPCFGPQQLHAELEGSKLFAKKAMNAAGVPTAEYDIIDDSTNINACLDARSHDPWVIKRDVLAGGKGVVVTSNREEAIEFIERSIQSDGHVLLERFLPGEEASMLVVMDKSGYVCLPPSQDHKRAYDGDKGPNTGGMGAYCPAPVVTETIHQKTVERIVEPMFSYLSSMDIPYRGVLYVGLMIDENGDPYVVEFNVRFGDPECQVTLPLVDGDVGELLYGAATDQISKMEVSFKSQHALTVVLASEGYPQSAIKDRLIHGADQRLDTSETWVSHAGTALDEQGNLISSGGRVLSVTSVSETLQKARELSYQRLGLIQLEGSHHRLDIGHRAL